MTRTRQIYNLFSVGIGPSPSSGFHYALFDNTPHNNPEMSVSDINLVNPINRVFEASYSLNINRENILHLGQSPTVKQVILNRPTIDLSFSYWIDGLENEINQGFDINHEIFSGFLLENDLVYDINAPKYSSNICPFAHFTGDNDSRNIFLTISPDFDNVNDRVNSQNYFSGVDPSLFPVMAFGNCYLNSYSFRYAVNEVPRASVSYSADNMLFHNSGSGVNIPAIHPKSGNLINGVYFTVPRHQTLTNPSIFYPSNLTVNLLNATGQNFGIYSNDIPLRSLDVSFSFQRDVLHSIGYVAPLNKKVNFPTFANISFEAVISGYTEDSLNNIIANSDHNFIVKCYNTPCGTELGAVYNVSGAKFNGLSESRQIGNTLITNFSYSVQIDPYDLGRGIFISGKKNNQPETYIYCLQLESNRTGFLYLENNNLLVL